MIISNERKVNLEFPKLNRRCLNSDKSYQLILQNTYTKEVYVIEIEDLSLNDLRFYFKLELPECLGVAEYDYYIVSNDEWTVDEINIHDVRETSEWTEDIKDKSAVSIEDKYIIVGGKMMVLRCGSNDDPIQKFMLADESEMRFRHKALAISGYDLGERESEGNICKQLEILSSGLFQFEKKRVISDNTPTYKSNKTYATYDKNREDKGQFLNIKPYERGKEI